MARTTTSKKSKAAAKPEAPEKEKPITKRGNKRAAEQEPEEKPEEKAPAAEPTSAKDNEEPPVEAPAPKRRRVAVKPAKVPSLFPGQPILDLFMFGTNSFGALGLGDPELADDPDTRSQIPRPKQPISEELKFVQVVCGGMHTVGLTSEGDVYTWGVNDEGALGRKTSGTCWEKEPDSAKGDPFVPLRAELPGGLKAVQIAAGDGFTFAVGADGCLYGCGHFKDEIGALSGFTPSIKTQGLFIQVWQPDSLRDRIKKLVCGGRHAAILTNRGDVLTWGSGSQGQLGRIQPYHQDSEYQPTAEELFKPTAVAHLPYALGNSPAVDIACGAYSTFVIAKDGSVAAWGLNNSGQLGINKENNDDNIKWEPETVESLSGVVHIAGGEQHTLALTKKGALLSFGAATYGMLGRRDVNTNSANEIHPEPKPVDGLEGLKVEAIAAGTNVSACTTSDGDAWFWGSNTNLQLAKGTDEDDEPVPKKMGRVKVFGYRRIHTVCFGGQHGALLAGEQGGVAPGGAAAAAAPAPAAAAAAAAGPSAAPAADGAGPSNAAAAAAGPSAAAPAAAAEDGAGPSAAPAAAAAKGGKKAAGKKAGGKKAPAKKKGEKKVEKKEEPEDDGPEAMDADSGSGENEEKDEGSE
ncbi:hypothetical protein Agub_g4649 [Astrephomene gubernaculifera]|uniref:RCC1-like domain-containing protein n=1 Tax=Astrephomene gubernaculifera TaxID=47775 RepID=A0AAD3DKK3_9CHLO|nr:hypothetical protein Agub_g4649 [Astrephomene gubernaculifera]